MKRKTLFLICSFTYLLIYSFTFAQPPASPARAQWLNGIGSPNTTGNGFTDERVTQLKIDSKGNTYVCGQTYGNAYIKTVGQHNNRTQINNPHQGNGLFTKGFIAKYDCGGQQIWFKEIGDNFAGTSVNDLCLDTAGNVYVVAQVNYGAHDTYWDDSLIVPVISPVPFANAGAGIVFKIDGTGKMLWHWSVQQQWGNTIHLLILSGNSCDNWNAPNYPTMVLSNDTLNFLTRVDSLNGKYAKAVYELNTQTGQFYQSIKLSDYVTAPSFLPTGIGKDVDGNMMAIGNISSNQANKILDTTLTLTSAVYGSMIILTFKGGHFLSAQFAADGVGSAACNFDSPENGFEVVVTAGQGARIFDSFYNTTKGVGSGGTIYALLQFDENKKLKWGLIPDTVFDSGGFLAITQDKNGSIYGCAVFDNVVRIQNYYRYFGTNGYAMFNLKMNLKDSLITAVFPDLPPVSNSGFGTVNSMAVNEKGEVIDAGFYSIATMLAGSDTATNEGSLDLFTIKYGYPCGTDSALIEPVATDNLKAICTNADSAKLTWIDNSNIEWGYHVYRATGSRTATYNLIATTLPNATMYFDKTISAGLNYWYKVAAFNNIGDGVYTNVDSSMGCKATGINALNKNTFAAKIYPNPTQTGEFTLSVQSNETGKAQLQISNYMGQIILDENVQLNNSNQWHLDLSKYSSGTYLVTLKTSLGSFGERVMVVR